MKITLLTMHRHESYDGEFGPEILAVVDEWTMEENPSWWAEEIARQRDLIGSDASAWAQVTIEVPADTLLDALYPQRSVTASNVVDTRSFPGLGDGADPKTMDLRIGIGSRVRDVEEGVLGVAKAIQGSFYVVVWDGDPLPRIHEADDIEFAEG